MKINEGDTMLSFIKTVFLEISCGFKSMQYGRKHKKKSLHKKFCA